MAEFHPTPVGGPIYCRDCGVEIPTDHLNDPGVHKSDCAYYAISKPRLFYFEEGLDAFVPCPDKIENIVDLDNFLGSDDSIAITFKRIDMTDAELDALPED